MAVVFISPKQRQKMFFVIITAIFVLFLIIVFFAVFISKPSEGSYTLVFNKPKVNVDLKIFDSDQFKNLQPFTEMETVYSYKATKEDGTIELGLVSAISEEKARARVTDKGLNIIELKEVEIGRDNPFTPYYESLFTPAP